VQSERHSDSCNPIQIDLLNAGVMAAATNEVNPKHPDFVKVQMIQS
jgi:hypothetical protein